MFRSIEPSLQSSSPKGYFGRHLRRMLQNYAERIDVLKTAADKYLNGVFGVVQAGAGIRTIGWLTTGGADHDAAQQAQKLGLEVIPLSTLAMKYQQPPHARLANCNPAEL